MLANTLVISAVSIQLEILSQYQWLTSLFCVSNNFLPSIIIIGTIVPTHSIVHTNSDDICGIWPQSSDTVCVSVGDPSPIVLMVAWWIIRITILNIVVVIKSSYSCGHGPLDGDTGVGSTNHHQVTNWSWRFWNRESWFIIILGEKSTQYLQLLYFGLQTHVLALLCIPWLTSAANACILLSSSEESCSAVANCNSYSTRDGVCWTWATGTGVWRWAIGPGRAGCEGT